MTEEPTDQLFEVAHRTLTQLTQENAVGHAGQNGNVTRCEPCTHEIIVRIVGLMSAVLLAKIAESGNQYTVEDATKDLQSCLKLGLNICEDLEQETGPRH